MADNIQSNNIDLTQNKNNDNPKNESEKYSLKEDSLELSDLSFKEKLAYRRQQQEQLLSTMNSQEKTTYIFQYYKWYFVIALFLIIGLFQIGKSIYQASLPTVLSIAFINNTGNSVIHEYVPDVYRSYYDLDNKNKIDVYSNLYKLTAEDSSALGLVITPEQQALSYDGTHDSLDVIICDQKALALYVSSDETAAIDSVLDADLYKQLEKYVITLSDPNGTQNDGNPYAIAIDVSETEFIKNCKLSYDHAYLVIPDTRLENNENTIQFIKFIFKI